MPQKSVVAEATENRYLIARRGAYGAITLVGLVAFYFTRDPRYAVLAALSVAVLTVDLANARGSHLARAIVVDSAATTVVWWLFGPVGEPDFVLLVLAAIAGVAFEGKQAAGLTAAVVGAAAVQIPLHLIGTRYTGLPLFHPVAQVVSGGEFIGGVLAQVAILIAAASLFRLVGIGVRRSTEQLAKSEAVLDAAFAGAPVGIVLLDNEGNILRTNHRMAELAGTHSLVGADACTLFDDGHVETVKRLIESSINRTSTAASQEAVLERTGTLCRLSVAPVQDDVGALRAVLLVEDITAEVEARRVLEDEVHAKDRFIASISHEIRTPLTAVVGFAAVLVESWKAMPQEEVDSLIAHIAAESAEVATIVEDLLVAARADMGTVTLIPEDLNVNDEIGQTIAALPMDPSEVIFDCEPAKVWADPLRFRQVLRNLLSNAIRYGGEHVRICSRAIGDTVEIIIADDGDGVPATEAERIFEPYQTANQSPTQPASVGLGLAVSRSLARAMGGDLVYRRVDGWSEFGLTLPATARVGPVPVD